jgi:hypothetical protein
MSTAVFSVGWLGFAPFGDAEAASSRANSSPVREGCNGGSAMRFIHRLLMLYHELAVGILHYRLRSSTPAWH